MRAYEVGYGPATVEIWDRYERSMARRNLAAGTIRARWYEIGRWIEGEPGWATATAEQIERYLDTRQLGARARYTSLSHLHRFYQWAQRVELVDRDPTLQIERPRLPRRLPRPARLDAVQLAILAAPGDLARAMTLMVEGGLRCCEVARLDWSDVDLAAGVMMIRGKGDRDRLVGMTDTLRATLARSDATTGPVFGRQATPCRVSQVVNAYLRRAGVPATAHQLRHTFATRMYGHLGGDLLALAQIMGHASVMNTQIYAAIDPAAALEAVRTLNRAA